MIIGYVLLGLVAVLMFFGLLNNTMKSMRVAPWAALFFVIALIVGGIIPMINFSDTVYVGIGGFIVPFVLMIGLLITVIMHRNVLRTVVGIALVAAFTTTVLVWMPNEIAWVAIISRFVIGLLSGAIAYAVCMDGLSAVTSAIGGIVWGNIAAQLALYFFNVNTSIVLGGSLIFDAIVMAAVFSVVLVIVAHRMRSVSHMHASASVEAAEDNNSDEWKKFDDYLDSNK